MKHISLILACLFGLLLAAPAHAVIRDRVLGIDVGANVPIGDLGDAIGTQFGALLRYEQTIAPNMAVTLRGGWLRGSEKEFSVGTTKFNIGMDSITLLGGVVYRTAGGPDGLFVSAEVGANMLSSHSTNATVSSDGKTKFGGDLGVGFRADALSFRGGVLVFDLSEAKKTMGALLTVGWDFKGL